MVFYTVEIFLFAGACVFIYLFTIVNKNPPAIFNVYQRPQGYYWLKVVFMYVILTLQRISIKSKLYFLSKEKLNKKYEELERPQPLSNHDQPIDAVYFNGANPNEEHLVTGMARRKNGLIDGFLFLKLNNSKFKIILETPKLPKTSIFQEKPIDEWKAEGINIYCKRPMEEWKIQYEGKMKDHENEKNIFDVKLDLTWSSDLPYFNFDCDMDPWCMAKCIAKEKWSREFFDLLKKNHQTHYEQHGDIVGNVEINGEKFDIKMNAMRDHSFGNHREWKNIHKYDFQSITAANGDRFTVGSFCIPILFSNFTMGFVYSAKEKKIHPITSNDFLLYQHGEGGEPPQDYAFSIEAGGKTYTIEVFVKNSPHFFISKDCEAKVTERFSTFRINGINGWGCSEWENRVR